MIEYKVHVYDNKTEWYLNGVLHREDGPAIVWANGDTDWWLNGKHHRKDGPAIEFADGSKFWYLNGKCHREDGPAVEYPDGTKLWHLNGELHREDGPAVEIFDGYTVWWFNGKHHREDAPAIKCTDSRKEYWLDGVQYTEEEFNKKGMLRLSDILQSMIKFNDKLQRKSPPDSYFEYADQVSHAKDFQTITYNSGRQCGKTTAIGNLVGDNDIIIVRNMQSINAFPERVKKKCYTMKNLRTTKFAGIRIENIWIDDASYYSSELIDVLYKDFSGKCKRFILLG